MKTRVEIGTLECRLDRGDDDCHFEQDPQMHRTPNGHLGVVKGPIM